MGVTGQCRNLWRRRFIAPFLSLAIACYPVALAAKVEDNKWREYTSAHFTVYSDGSPRKVRKLVEELELFHAGLLRVTENVDKDIKADLIIYAAKNRSSYKGLFQGHAGGFSGYFKYVGDQSIAAIDLSAKAIKKGSYRNAATSIVFHEYVHFVMARGSRIRNPLWYNEGFAEFLSTLEVKKDGAIKLGLPNESRFYDTVRYDHIPLRQILRATDLPDESEGVSYFYGRSWLLVHYLQNHEERRLQNMAFLSRLHRGLSVQVAFDRSFDISIAELEAELNKYAKPRRFPYFPLKFDDFEPTLEVRDRLLSPAERAITVAAAVRHFGGADGRDYARKIIDKAIRKSPDDGRLRAHLALEILEEEGPEAAAPHIRRALDLLPGDVDVLMAAAEWHAARAIMGSLPPEERDASKAEIGETYAQILETDPNHGKALFEMAQRALRRNDLDQALAFAQRAHEAVPTSDTNLFLLANVCATKGDYAAAVTHLKTLVAMTGNNALRAAAQRLLDTLERL